MPTMFAQQNHVLRSYGYLRRYEQAAAPRILRREEHNGQSEPFCIPGKPERFLKCCYCNKVFRSPQAFGGHHNKHRKEREVMLKEHEEELIRSRGETQLTLSTPSVARNTLTLFPDDHDRANDTSTNNNSSSEAAARENEPEIRPQLDINEEPSDEDELMTESYLDQMEGKIQNTASNKFENEISPSTSLSLAYDVDVTLKL